MKELCSEPFKIPGNCCFNHICDGGVREHIFSCGSCSHGTDDCRCVLSMGGILCLDEGNKDWVRDGLWLPEKGELAAHCPS